MLAGTVLYTASGEIVYDVVDIGLDSESEPSIAFSGKTIQWRTGNPTTIVKPAVTETNDVLYVRGGGTISCVVGFEAPYVTALVPSERVIGNDEGIQRFDETASPLKVDTRGWVFGVEFEDGVSRHHQILRMEWQMPTGTQSLVYESLSGARVRLRVGCMLWWYKQLPTIVSCSRVIDLLVINDSLVHNRDRDGGDPCRGCCEDLSCAAFHQYTGVIENAAAVGGDGGFEQPHGRAPIRWRSGRASCVGSRLEPHGGA